MVAHNLIVMSAALALDACIGDPAWLYKRIPHPVAWMGNLLVLLDRALNRRPASPGFGIVAGALTLMVLLALSGAVAWALDHVLSRSWTGMAVLALLASTLLAQRSLYDHAHAVAMPLRADDIEGARTALGQIVGRDVRSLDHSAICRAAIESLFENLSDGVVAPLFWGCLLGFPGLVLYKAINTADSMIGHRTPKHLYFGRVSARIDDLVNLVPARLTGLLVALAGMSARALRVMATEARHHRSPNAGWPEAAIAGVLDIRLSGPRAYHGEITNEPWIHGEGSLPLVADLDRGLQIMLRACAILFVLVLAAALYFSFNGRPATISSTWLTAVAID
ncbi:MAG: adenosylcobinamide-phosphate synthase CbiB [Rhizomicrobium sp.]